VDQTCNEKIPKSAKISGFSVLPSNNYTAVVQAIATIGPMAITVHSIFHLPLFSSCSSSSSFTHLL
jgi:hypothetical protein